MKMHVALEETKAYLIKIEIDWKAIWVYFIVLFSYFI